MATTVQVHSPTTTDAPLEYLTVESYEWPKPVRPKRCRMGPDERRRRHREDQRRFMIRKQERIETLRREVALAETQLQLLWALHEERVLRQERRQLEEPHQIDHATEQRSKEISPSLAPLVEAAPIDSILSDVLLSL